eukprot:SAG11_NODE_645_length_7983_cov_5.727596_8_plen_212_part_01
MAVKGGVLGRTNSRALQAIATPSRRGAASAWERPAGHHGSPTSLPAHQDAQLSPGTSSSSLLASPAPSVAQSPDNAVHAAAGEWHLPAHLPAERNERVLYGVCPFCNEKRVRGQCGCRCLYCLGHGHPAKLCPRKDGHVVTAFRALPPPPLRANQPDEAAAAAALRRDAREREAARRARSVAARVVDEAEEASAQLAVLEGAEAAANSRLQR